jgi:hypothetical protein
VRHGTAFYGAFIRLILAGPARFDRTDCGHGNEKNQGNGEEYFFHIIPPFVLLITYTSLRESQMIFYIKAGLPQCSDASAFLFEVFRLTLRFPIDY